MSLSERLAAARRDRDVAANEGVTSSQQVSSRPGARARRKRYPPQLRTPGRPGVPPRHPPETPSHGGGTGEGAAGGLSQPIPTPARSRSPP